VSQGDILNYSPLIYYICRNTKIVHVTINSYLFYVYLHTLLFIVRFMSTLLHDRQNTLYLFYLNKHQMCKLQLLFKTERMLHIKKMLFLFLNIP
jgi:hypothetical protein